MNFYFFWLKIYKYEKKLPRKQQKEKNYKKLTKFTKAVEFL